MKPEREIIWIIKLLQSDLTPGFFTKKAGTKKDFERTLQAPTDSKEFHQWFQELLEEGSIEDATQNNDINKKTMYTKYVCNKKNMEQRLKNLTCYKEIYQYFNKDRIIPGTQPKPE